MLNEGKNGALERVWEKIFATACLRRVVVVIHEHPRVNRLSRKHDRRYNTTHVACSEFALLPARTISFGHAAEWADYAERDWQSNSNYQATTIQSHTWTCVEDGNLVTLHDHCLGILRRRDGLLNKGCAHSSIGPAILNKSSTSKNSTKSCA